MRGEGRDKGFTLVELMVVVLIIGVLVAIATPLYAAAVHTAEERTCYHNQRVIESSAQLWSANHDQDMTPLEGVVTGSHPLIDVYIFAVPPRCESAPEPADIMTVDVAHGAYTLDADGNVSGCTHGTPEHGLYR